MTNHAITPDLILIRDIFTTRMTLGQLFHQSRPLSLGGNLIYMGEDEARPAGVKIDTLSCIWEGDYWIRITMSSRFKKLLPLVYNNEQTLEVESGTKKFSGIRWHPGNGEADTDGCQLPGLTRNTSGVWRSGDAMDLIMPWLTGLIATAPGNKIPFRIINRQS
jgi:hypothetical protein